MSDYSAPLRCKCRRQAVTGLRCSRCNVPICPDCSKMYPVGMLCRDCARGTRSSLHIVSGTNLTKAILACLALAAFGGWLLADAVGFGFMGLLWGGLLYAAAMGELALRMTGRKRGPVMEVLAGGMAALGIPLGWLLQALRSGEIAEPDWFFAHLTNPWSYLLIVGVVIVAVARIRSL